MELLTDILAIVGFSIIGYFLLDTKLFDHGGYVLRIGLCLAFGLIAASLVLG